MSPVDLFQIGVGPSSSHTMGPQRAATLFLERHPDVQRVQVTLFGSLAATGRGHLTDVAIERVFAPRPVEFTWLPQTVLPGHANAMEFAPVDEHGVAGERWRVYSIGGGRIVEDGPAVAPRGAPVTMQALLDWCEATGQPLWRRVEESGGTEALQHLERVRAAMAAAVERGLHAEGVLPGGLRLARKARSYLLKARRCRDPFRRTGLVAAYALAVAEENAVGGTVVTAPTCGSCGVVPAVLRYVQETVECRDEDVVRALATAAVVGDVVRTNASISGAEVGCQGEIGTACAMAAAAAAQLLGATPRQIEYAAEMGLEHHLGLTCDPVAGLVQIPCIERNAFAATRALDCADLALLSDGTHRVSFDEVVLTMLRTGRDLASAYRETAGGGLAVLRR